MRADRPPGRPLTRGWAMFWAAMGAVLSMIVIGIARGGGITQIDWRGAVPIALFSFAVAVLLIMLRPLPGSRA